MRRSLYLYLFIIAVLLNLFTYMYFTKMAPTGSSPNAEASTADCKKWQDSVTVLYNKWVDGAYFDLEGNQHAQEYFDNQTTPNALTHDQIPPLVIGKLLDYNDAREGNKYTGYEPMDGQKFIINKAKVLNHRWIIADFSNGSIWGETLIKYFINDDKSVDFEMVESVIYPKEIVQTQ